MSDTKEIIHIIIVEDDKAQQEMYQACIEEFNIEDDKYEVREHILPNDDAIPQLLYNNHIDAIIVDLDWGTGKQHNEGNHLVEKIYKECRIPIYIVSGNLHLLEEDYKESPILKKYKRDDIQIIDLLKEIKDIYITGYTRMLGNHSRIDEMLSKVFWVHLVEVIDQWKENNSNAQFQRVLRFAMTRINEMLMINPDEQHDDYDAIEFYIKPAIKEKPFTGDIVSYDDKKFIVITAACDMEQDKCDYVVLCKIDFDILTDLKTKVKENSQNSINKLCSYINNGKPRYHLLPPCKLFDGGLIDFQNIKSMNKDDFYENASVVASINPVFVKDIQCRFSHYYGRQGQPQLNKDKIIQWMQQN